MSFNGLGGDPVFERVTVCTSRVRAVPLKHSGVYPLYHSWQYTP